MKSILNNAKHVARAAPAAETTSLDSQLGAASDQFIVRRGEVPQRPRPQHHCRLSLVCGLGPRHHDFSAGPRDGPGAATTLPPAS